MRVWWKPKGARGDHVRKFGTAVVLFMDVINLIPNLFILINEYNLIC
jgi:hypothetical protein